MNRPPIAFFTYNRPEHTRRSLTSLAQNEGADESELYIFCDAPKRDIDQESVEQVRHVVGSHPWCGTVHIIEQTENQGCAASIIQGVTKLCQEYGQVIVIEDDLILSPYFLDYMGRALAAYADSPSVMQISGHMFPVQLTTQSDSIFLPLTTSWGWATWQRAWQYFDAEMSGYETLQKNKRLRHQFDLNGSYPYFSMLEAQRNGHIDSWAIRWYLSMFMRQGLTLYPVRSLVSNIGFDGSGTHCGTQKQEVSDFSTEFQDIGYSFPTAVSVNFAVLRALQRYLYQPRNKTSFSKTPQKVLKLIRKLAMKTTR